jgi:membrane-bound lytic murein transglycosylase B
VRLAAAAALLVVFAACGGSGPSAGPSPTPSPVREAPIPRDAEAMAAELTAVWSELRGAIAAWRRDGDPATGDAPPEVVRLAERQRALYRRLADRPGLARRTLPLVHGRRRGEARDVIAARRALAVLNAPFAKARRKLKTGPAEPADVLLGHYREAERRYGVGWQLLAAVNLVETLFGRVRSRSVAGAQGPMQFIPSTWRAYGRGDIDDPRDAILGAANYLHASGAPGDESGALYAYNPSRLYVRAVSRYARRMRRDPESFYVFYAWRP